MRADDIVLMLQEGPYVGADTVAGSGCPEYEFEISELDFRFLGKYRRQRRVTGENEIQISVLGSQSSTTRRIETRNQP